MELCAIPNLATDQVFDCEPWNYTSSIPESVDYTVWKSRPTTRHCFYSGFVGLEPYLRCNKSNAPHKLRAFVVDYDYDPKIIPDPAAAFEENYPTGYLPNYVIKTRSGRTRLVFLLNKEVILGSLDLVKTLLAEARKELKLEQVLPGMDKCFLNPYQYYELGTNWQQINPTPMDSRLICKWLFTAGDRVNWERGRNDPDIPIEAIAKELNKMYPGKWPGPIELGARGPTFWDSGNHTSTDSAVIRASGMQAFNMPKSFYSWREIFGNVFVDAYQADHTGEIVENTFYTETKKEFWFKNSDGAWQGHNKDMTSMIFAVKHNLERAKPKGARQSEMERVLTHIIDCNTVARAMPFIHQKPGLIYHDNVRVLNTCCIKALTPSGVSGDWGEHFPWLAQYFDTYFGTQDPLQKPVWMAWARRAYMSGLNYEPTLGQIQFHAGKTGAGKNLLNEGIMGKLMGGFATASSYLTTDEKFNDDLAGKPLWVMNDATPTSSFEKHQKYSATIKQVAADMTLRYEKKFGDSGTMIWPGRVMVSFNDDPESVQMIPSLEASILDKVQLFLIHSPPEDRPIPQYAALNKILKRELTHFAQWLLNWEPPSYVLGEPRYEVISYHNPKLYRAGIEQGSSHAFLQVLVIFMEAWASDVGKDLECWQGNASNLLAEMGHTEYCSGPLIKDLTPRKVGKALDQLKNRGYNLTQKEKRSAGGNVWLIPKEIKQEGESHESSDDNVGHV